MTQKKNFLSIFTLILSLIVLSVGGYYVWQASQKISTTETPNIHEDAYYSIRSNATELQINLYDALIEAIESSAQDTEIASLVAQNFMVDFFTWSNKTAIYDIGGLQFVDSSIRDNVYNLAKNTIYTPMIDLLEAGTAKSALEVDTIKVDSSEAIDYVLVSEDENEETVETPIEAIEVQISWTYKDSTVMDPSAYDTTARVVLTKGDDGLYYVVEVNYEEASV